MYLIVVIVLSVLLLGTLVAYLKKYREEIIEIEKQRQLRKEKLS